MVAADCVNDKILFSNLVKPCTSMGIFASALGLASICESCLAKMTSNLSSIELVERAPTLSKSETEPPEEPKFEEKYCNGESGTFACSAPSNKRTSPMTTSVKQQNWFVNLWTKQNQKTLRRRKSDACSMKN